jgi:hypothetical protein
MRVTIIPSDGFVSVDGVGYSDLDLAAIDATVHAVQWWGESGEVEVKDAATGKMQANVEIDSLDTFQLALAAWQAAKDAAIAAEAAAAAEREAAEQAAAQEEAPSP